MIPGTSNHSQCNIMVFHNTNYSRNNTMFRKEETAKKILIICTEVVSSWYLAYLIQYSAYKLDYFS